MSPTEDALTAKVKLLEAENFKLKNMLKSNFNATCRFVEMLSDMDDLLVKRKNEIDQLTGSLENKTAELNELKIQLKAAQESMHRVSEKVPTSTFYEDRQKRAREIESVKKSKTKD